MNPTALHAQRYRPTAAAHRPGPGTVSTPAPLWASTVLALLVVMLLLAFASVVSDGVRRGEMRRLAFAGQPAPDGLCSTDAAQHAALSPATAGRLARTITDQTTLECP